MTALGCLQVAFGFGSYFWPQTTLHGLSKSQAAMNGGLDSHPGIFFVCKTCQTQPPNVGADRQQPRFDVTLSLPCWEGMMQDLHFGF